MRQALRLVEKSGVPRCCQKLGDQTTARVPDQISTSGGCCEMGYRQAGRGQNRLASSRQLVGTGDLKGVGAHTGRSPMLLGGVSRRGARPLLQGLGMNE